jgi:hypothetical protein
MHYKMYHSIKYYVKHNHLIVFQVYFIVLVCTDILYMGRLMPTANNNNNNAMHSGSG